MHPADEARHLRLPGHAQGVPLLLRPALWTEYLDFLAENRFNYIAFWNGHPFDYFVKLDKYPEAQAGMEPGSAASGTTRCSMWLAKEAEKRNIWLMFQFYNIHTSVYFQKAHDLPAWNPQAHAAVGRLHRLLHRAVRQRVPQRRPVHLPRRGAAAGVHRRLDQGRDLRRGQADRQDAADHGARLGHRPAAHAEAGRAATRGSTPSGSSTSR